MKVSNSYITFGKYVEIHLSTVVNTKTQTNAELVVPENLPRR